MADRIPQTVTITACPTCGRTSLGLAGTLPATHDDLKTYAWSSKRVRCAGEAVPVTYTRVTA